MAGWVAASVVVLAATAVQAQTIQVQTWGYPDDAVIMRRGPYGALPPGPVRGGYLDDEAYDDAVPSREVVKMVRSLGFKPLGPAVRQRRVYTVSAVSREGQEGRVVVDAYTGRMMRFAPTTAGGAEPGGAPVAASPQPPKEAPKEPPKADARVSPPLPAPRVASRTPPNQSPTPPAPVQPAEAPAVTATTTPEARTAGAAPPAQPKTAEAKVLDAKPADTRSVQAKPSVQLLPTQEMPPVQGLD
ncbi:hypothetical protein [Bradyrhizobium prioriisuperbiae]|uniref:hypothetical protein n=1 Tax=Bradyrhizobium prioriisuperbiae TaxID=2854389 RepID=UPI0028EBA206|nr:hypothetical protein [Bradyrhizobium prioritasuperba]